VERAVLAGDAATGVCLMNVEAGLDTGAVYAEVSTAIDAAESAEQLRHRLVDLGCGMLQRCLADGMAGLPVARPQTGTPTYAEKIRPDELRLRWELPASHLHRVVRLGRAWTTLGGKRLRILAAEVVDAAEQLPTAPEGASPGALDGELVAAGEGTLLRLVTVQPEGKQPMAAADWLRGVRPRAGARFEG
jgi:methionyl-tRNA formyltransferase